MQRTCGHRQNHSKAVCPEIERLDQLIAEADGDSGFNEDFLLQMGEDDVLDAYHDADQATAQERENLLEAMKRYALRRKIV